MKLGVNETPCYASLHYKRAQYHAQGHYRWDPLAKTNRKSEKSTSSPLASQSSLLRPLAQNVQSAKNGENRTQKRALLQCERREIDYRHILSFRGFLPRYLVFCSAGCDVAMYSSTHFFIWAKSRYIVHKANQQKAVHAFSSSLQKR